MVEINIHMKRTNETEKSIRAIAEGNYHPPALPENIPQGDMPSDKICINEYHIHKAHTILPLLAKQLQPHIAQNPYERAVAVVCGGSGVGKSEIASILGYYFTDAGVSSYILSGDNYPRRVPRQNDAERLRIFRVGGIQGLVVNGLYNSEMAKILQELQLSGQDASPSALPEHPWLAIYQREGKKALKAYLGTPAEIDFPELENIVAAFKNGADKIWLKNMGREATDIRYENIDFSSKKLLIIEWTHGNSDYYKGVDVSVLLNSTPEETLAHRRARGRDDQADSAFTNMVLELEQQLLHSQAHKARVIIAKDGQPLDLQEYKALMAKA